MPEDQTTDEGDALRNLGAQLDASDGETTQDTPTETVEPAKPKTEPEADDQPPSETEKQPEAESADTAADKTGESDKPKSKYEKAMDRQAKAWKEITETKEILRREKEELEKARASIKPAAEKPKRDGYTADQYETAVKNALELARKAREEDFDEDAAKQHAAQASQFAKIRDELLEEDKTRQRTSFMSKWNAQADEIAKLDPDIRADRESKTVSSPTGKMIVEVLKELPLFAQLPDGLKYAHPIAKARMQAAAMSALQKQVQELTKEKERLTKLTSVSGSGPARISTSKSGDLSEADMRRMAEDFDTNVAA